MAKVSNSPLKPNPYLTYRNPETGVWQVISVHSLTNSTEKSLSQSVGNVS